MGCKVSVETNFPSKNRCAFWDVPLRAVGAGCFQKSSRAEGAVGGQCLHGRAWCGVVPRGVQGRLGDRACTGAGMHRAAGEGAMLVGPGEVPSVAQLPAGGSRFPGSRPLCLAAASLSCEPSAGGSPPEPSACGWETSLGFRCRETLPSCPWGRPRGGGRGGAEGGAGAMRPALRQRPALAAGNCSLSDCRWRLPGVLCGVRVQAQVSLVERR